MGRKDSEKEKKSSKRRKRERSSSSSSTSSSSVSLSSIDEETKKKLMKKLKKLKKKEKRKKKEKKALKKLKKSKVKDETLTPEKKVDVPCSSKTDISDDLMEKSRSLAPMTKEEWEKQQNTLRRVYDEETGRMRLIKGTGEIVEECVSRERHLAINKQATKGDGEYFQKRLLQQMK